MDVSYYLEHQEKASLLGIMEVMIIVDVSYGIQVVMENIGSIATKNIFVQVGGQLQQQLSGMLLNNLSNNYFKLSN